MARIRSVHPGLFTDEAFVGLSSDAQMFFIGLWTEADDQGVFEWKPVTLRMRLRPTKDGSVDGLLEELLAGNCIQKYEIDGRQYGAVRNFRKFQRPKSPNAVHPMSDDIRNYVGLSDPISEIEKANPPTVAPKGEIAPQMEDGGKEEGKEEVKYAFSGRVVKLLSRDYSAWKRTYHAISDLDAELQRIDANLSAKPDGKWFVAAAAMLNAKHQKIMGDRQAGKPKITPLGVGG